jgi:hypothetical protein
VLGVILTDEGHGHGDLCCKKGARRWSIFRRGRRLTSPIDCTPPLALQHSGRGLRQSLRTLQE